MQQDIQSYIRAGQQARDYYNKNTTKSEVKKDKKEKEDDATFATVGKSLGDVISKSKQPTFGFDKSSGVKIAGAISNPLQSTLKELSPLHTGNL